MTPTERTERTLGISAYTPENKAPFSERHPLIAGFGRGIAAGIFLLGMSCTRPMGVLPSTPDQVLAARPDSQAVPSCLADPLCEPDRVYSAHARSASHYFAAPPYAHTSDESLQPGVRPSLTLNLGIYTAFQNPSPTFPRGPQSLDTGALMIGPIIKFEIPDR